MEYSYFFTIFYALLASWLVCLTSAKPTPASYYPEFYDADNYYVPYVEPLTDFPVSRLRRGYYYVDNGYITAVGASPLPSGRRLDTGNDVIRISDRNAVRVAADRNTVRIADRADHYTPLLRYKAQSAKRKKLFVPNLYG